MSKLAPVPPPAATPVAPNPGPVTDLATLLDESAARAWYRRPLCWGVALLLLAGAGLW